MKCQECKKNGINPLSKMGLIFGLEVRCSQCGTAYRLHKGLSFFISVALQFSILVSIFYAFVQLEKYIAYVGVVLGFTLLGAIALVLPVKKLPGLKLRRTRS